MRVGKEGVRVFKKSRLARAMIQRQEEARWASGIVVAQCDWSTEEGMANSRK